jgi:hypothetical protein
MKQPLLSVPELFVDLPRLVQCDSAWRGLDRILFDIVKRFNIPQKSALEFGVEFGYSTSALACVFDSVIGVDTFTGDEMSVCKDHYAETSARLRQHWPNVRLYQVPYRDWISQDTDRYDLVHIDIVHTYTNTYCAGIWAIQHAPVVLFHDTESYPEVKIAVGDLAQTFDKTFYNYPECHGLGILV